VHEWGVPGAAIAARDAGIRGLWHGFGRMFPDGIGLEMPMEVADVPHLDICPPSLQDPAFLAAAERIVLRPVAFAPPGARVEVGEPFVYLTLGTAFGTSERLRSAIAGLAGLGLPVVVAPGRVPTAALGEIPAGVTVAGWVDQAELLPRAALVVHHGGSGTTLGALAAGVPQLLLPQGADQFANADAVAAAGAGLRLPDAEHIADGARRLLGDASFRDAARDMAREIAGMPAPEDVARSIGR
jgi:UDP:flavonoid glycosyltransferase YjiC (YdhE family)